MTLRTLAEDKLLALGAAPHLRGFRLIVMAVEHVDADPELIYAVTKGLYPVLCQETGTTLTSVERAIRNCIATLYDNNDYDTIAEAIGNIAPARTGAASNAAFIAALHLRCRRELDDNAN